MPPKTSAFLHLSSRLLILAFTAVLFMLAISGCTSTEEQTSSSSTPTSSERVSRAHAEALWLHVFKGFLVAGEGQTMKTNGVEQHCEAKGNDWQCRGVIPEENSPFPSKDTNCMIVEATVTGAGKLTEESAQPLSKVREALKQEVECHL
jgi:hypothetical protein